MKLHGEERRVYFVDKSSHSFAQIVRLLVPASTRHSRSTEEKGNAWTGKIADAD